MCEWSWVRAYARGIVFNLFAMCLRTASLCWVEWLEKLCTVVSMAVGFLNIPNSYLSLLTSLISRKIRILTFSLFEYEIYVKAKTAVLGTSLIFICVHIVRVWVLICLHNLHGNRLLSSMVELSVFKMLHKYFRQYCDPMWGVYPIPNQSLAR